MHGRIQISAAHAVVDQCPDRMAFHLTVLKMKDNLKKAAHLNYYLPSLYFCPYTHTPIWVKILFVVQESEIVRFKFSESCTHSSSKGRDSLLLAQISALDEDLVIL